MLPIQFKRAKLTHNNNNIFCNKVAGESFPPYIRVMNFRVNWDAMGIATSVACAIHCAVLPLVITSFPVFGINIIDNVAFEYLMIVLALAIGLYSLWHGYKKHHHSLVPIGIFSFGILLLVAKQLWHEYQLWLLPGAVILIITAHLINYRSCRVHNHAHAEDCDH
jgi:hypothetical protein